MTTRRRRLVGRAHRRRAQGVPLASPAARMALYEDQVPGLRESFAVVLAQLTQAWGQIRDAVRSALTGTRADYVLMPPPRPRHTGQLLHNGRKPR